jgi:crotonobetainyl-CoA:carnitine CoA-transferase CaiB-like acyl-CoA transferase
MSATSKTNSRISNAMAGPLSHIRVLDLSRVLAGPWAGQNLADLGAEVIKVERPKIGDDSRAFGPPWIKDQEGRDSKDSAYFTAANRGKKYKFGDLARYGLGYEDLRKVNPRLIYCSVTGFGQTGPYKEHPGYDFMVQGMGGMMSVTGEPDNAPGGGPQRAGVPVADIITGMYASIAICAALTHRAETGIGQHLDLALLDSQIALLAYQNTNYFSTGVPPKRIGNLHPNIVPYQPFKTSDGDVILACGNDNLFKKFCEAAGCPQYITDARFATNGKRVENRVELTRLLQDVFSKRTTREWVTVLEAAGVPNGPINNLAQVFEEPQVKARGIRVEMDHPVAGKLSTVASPMRFSATPVEYKFPPPLVGEHSDAVLRGLLGKSEADIARLREGGIV